MRALLLLAVPMIVVGCTEDRATVYQTLRDAENSSHASWLPEGIPSDAKDISIASNVERDEVVISFVSGKLEQFHRQNKMRVVEDDKLKELATSQLPLDEVRNYEHVFFSCNHQRDESLPGVRTKIIFFATRDSRGTFWNTRYSEVVTKFCGKSVSSG